VSVPSAEYPDRENAPNLGAHLYDVLSTSEGDIVDDGGRAVVFLLGFELLTVVNPVTFKLYPKGVDCALRKRLG